MKLFKFIIEYSIVFAHTPDTEETYRKHIYCLDKTSKKALDKIFEKYKDTPEGMLIETINVVDFQEVTFTDLSTSISSFIY